MSSRDQALKAVEVGLAIIPTRNKIPLGVSQDKPITTTVTAEAYWYPSRTEMPGVGIVSEACDIPLMFLDIDVKGGVDGYASLANAGLDILDTPIRYKSSSGNGEHLWYRAPKESLGKVTSRASFTYKGERLTGVDNRIGNGYVVIPAGFEIPSREILESLPLAPEWLWKTSEKDSKSEATKFDGDSSEWLKNLAVNTEGNYSADVQKIVNSIPFVIDHEIMRNLQKAIVCEGAKGSEGAAKALEVLKAAYLRGEYDTAEYRKEWENALHGAIEKFGTPDYDATQTQNYFGGPKGTTFLAHKFATDMADDVALDGSGNFWTYDNGVWSYNPNIHTKVLSDSLRDAYMKNYETTVGDHLRSMLVGKEIKDEPNTALINLANGMYNWKTGELKEHNPQYLSTVQLPISYDPNATCPNFDKWLSETLPGDEKLAMQVIGYMMMSGNPFHKAILLVGSGRNGKSTFLRVLQKMMGDGNYSSLTLRSLSTERFAPVALFGKLANIAGDIHEGHLNDSTTFKAITGGDPITAERKGQMAFSFKPWSTLIFSTNEMWSSSDTSDGYIERWLPIPFNQKFTANGKFDENILYAEVNGIFNKAMVALQDLMATGKFSSSDAQQELVEEFRENSDSVLQWLHDLDYVKTADNTNLTIHTKRKDLYESYRLYRKGKFCLTSKKFYDDLERKGFITKTRDGFPHIYGIEAYTVSSFGEVMHPFESEVTAY